MSDIENGQVPGAPEGDEGRRGRARGTQRPQRRHPPCRRPSLGRGERLVGKGSSQGQRLLLHHLMEMLAAEMHEKHQTIVELTSRIDMQDEKISERVNSCSTRHSYGRRSGDGRTGSDQKREFVRNILSNAAQTAIVSDDVVKLFLEWVGITPSGTSRSSPGSTTMRASRAAACGGRSGRAQVREDSADAVYSSGLIFLRTASYRPDRPAASSDGWGTGTS